MPSLRILAASAALWCALGMTLVGDGRSLRVDDVTGRTIAPFAPSGAAGVLFFVQSDCPVSNTYAPEIQHVCREYGTRGVSCALVYEDLEIGSARGHLNDIVRRHVREYGLTGIPAAADRTRAIAKEARELICKADRLAFPVKDDIPVMLEEEARTLAPNEEP